MTKHTKGGCKGLGGSFVGLMGASVGLSGDKEGQMEKRTVYQVMINWGRMALSEPVGEKTEDKSEAIFRAKKASGAAPKGHWHTVDQIEEIWNEAENQWECEDCVQVFDARQ